MIYLYGILRTESGALPKDAFDSLCGIGGDVSFAPCDDLVLLFGDHDGSEILPRRRALLSHARVLEAAMVFGTVLPMRFGMTCPSLAAFEDLVRSADDKVRAGLDRLKGQIEIGVRILASESAALSAAIEASPDLLARRAKLSEQGAEAHFAKVDFGRALGDTVAARRNEAQKSLVTELKRLCPDYVLKAPESDFQILRAEFLVDQNCLSDFTRVLEEKVATLEFAPLEACTVRLVGPGPAFHFVGFSLDTATHEEVA